MEERSYYPLFIKLFLMSFILIIIGFFIITLATLYYASPGEGKVSVSGGFLLLLGFIPIGFAFGPHGEYVMITLVLLAIMLIVLSLFLRRSLRV